MIKEKNYRGWAIVFVSFLILMFIFATCISCMGVYLKPITEEFGISRTDFTLTTTIQALAMMLSAMLAGKLLEKYNTKLLMVIGTLCCSTCMFIYAAAPSIVYFYAASLLMGISISLTCNIPISIVIKDWFRNKNEGLALGIAFVGSGAGAMILNPLYTYIIETFGWRYSFAFAGMCVLIIVMPLVLLVIKKKPAEEADDKYGESNVALAEEDFTLSEAVKKPQTWIVFAAYTLLTFVAMAILNHGVPFMTDNGMSAEKAAMIISFGSGVLIIGKILVGNLYDKLGVYKVNLLEAVLLLGCFFVFWMNGLLDSPILLILFIVLYGIGVPVATISIQLVLPVMYGKSHFGAIMGFFSIGNGIGGMMQIIISMIYDKTGSYTAAWVMVSIMCIMIIIVFATCIRPLKKGGETIDERRI